MSLSKALSFGISASHGFGFHFPVCFLHARWRPLLDVISVDHTITTKMSMHSSISFPKQTKSPAMFYRYHDLKRMEREQQRLEQEASSSACSSTPLGDDLGTNEFRPTDGVKTSNQKQAVGEVAPRRISLDTSELQQTSSSSKTTAVSTSKAQHTTEHPLQKLHVPKKRRKSHMTNESHTEQEETSTHATSSCHATVVSSKKVTTGTARSNGTSDSHAPLSVSPIKHLLQRRRHPSTEQEETCNHEDRITHKERHDDIDSSKRSASVELIFDEDPIINKILSDLYHDFLSKSSNDGDVSSLSYDDKMLLEAASTGEAFKMLVNDAAEFDILPTAFQSSRWIV